MASLREENQRGVGFIDKSGSISAMGQREIMKAMHPGMSETEIQGIHEFVYKKYGSEFEDILRLWAQGTTVVCYIILKTAK
jgi:Xaa-Pro aminopeptidase